ncbi:MAG: Lipopolysaccharide biosynthesis [uncultured bacterium]|nr:MAG: Lipopolysaccharide biosynthesis [uncultured bacterium]HBH17436.1 hypothetical protein [Cyanobacteria bacterium UBA9579]
MDINNKINKNRYIKNFFKDRNLIFVITAIIFIWTIIYLIFFYQPVYKSNAKVWIKELTTESFVANLNSESQLTPLTSAGNPILTQIEILKSNQLKDFLVNYIKNNYPEFSKKSIKEIRDIVDKSLKAKSKVGTDIINITVSWNAPQEAKKLLQLVLKEYDSINLLINKKIRTARRKYIDIKLAEIENKLSEIRKDIKGYKSENLAINLDTESDRLIEQKILISTKLEEVNASVSSLQSSINELEQQLSLKPNEALNAVALGANNQNLVELRTNLNQAIQQYEYDIIKLADTNPRIIAQKNKIEAIKRQIKEQIKLSLGEYANNQKINIFDPVREKLAENLITNQVKFISLKAEQQSLNDSISKINLVLAGIPEKKFTLDNLEQTERTLSKAYDELREKQIEAKIKEAEAVSSIVIVDIPDLPKEASFPTPIHVLTLAVLFGFGLGLSASVLKTLIEDICDDPELIEYITQSSILGAIPWTEKAFDNEKASIISNIAYNNVLSSLLIKCYKQNAKVLTFTSTALKKPQSSIMYQLACGLEKQGHSVVIIDADFRIPAICKSAQIDNKIKANLSDLIIHFENQTRKKQPLSSENVLDSLIIDNNKISHLGNRDAVLEPYEFFGTSAFSFIVETLKEKFDWVLIDTGAAHITPEFLIVSRLSDGVVLLANRTITYSILDSVSKSIREAGISIIGTIIRESNSRLEREYEKYLLSQEDEASQQSDIIDLEWDNNQA